MDELTPKQQEVIRLMAKGLTNGQIAAQMGISLAGAKWHVSEVLSKLGVDSREEAVMLWKAERSLSRRFSGMAAAISLPQFAVWGGAATAGVGGMVVLAAVVLSGAVGADDSSFVADPPESLQGNDEVMRLELQEATDIIQQLRDIPFELLESDDLQTMEFTDSTVRLAMKGGCLWVAIEPNGLMGACPDDGTFATRPVRGSSWRPVPGNRVSFTIIAGPEAAYVEIVDEQGNVQREAAQTIESSPEGLRYVYIDRMLEAPATSIRLVADDGTELADVTWLRGSFNSLTVPELAGYNPPHPPGTEHSFFGPGSQNTRPFFVDEPPYSDGRWTVTYDGEDDIVVALECDPDRVPVFEGRGPLGDIEISVEYPSGATVCTWRVDTTGHWSIEAR